MTSPISPRHSSLLLLQVQLLALLLLPISLPTVSANDAVTAVIALNNVTSPPIHPNFVSFSLEVSGAQGWVGSNSSSPKPSFLTLMRHLMFTPNQPGPILRIGGNSADESWWNPTHLPRLPNITYDIQPIDLIAVNNAATALNSTAVYGLNFRRGDNSSWAVAHTQAIDRYIGWERAILEIGNECDLYAGNGIRAHNYTFGQYDVEWQRYANDIAAAVPNAPAKLFQGATFAGRGWYPNISSYAHQHSAQLRSVSIHTYPSTHCSGHNVTLAQLLSDSDSQTDASHILSSNLSSSISPLPLQVGEGNSASCGGMPGVSNVFAAALWAIDDLYNLAAVGVRGMNFHGGGSSTQSYSAIVWSGATSDQPRVQPLFYGLQFFAMGTRNWPAIVSVQAMKTTNSQVKVHATWDGKRAAVMLIHKNMTSTEPATVQLMFPAPSTVGWVWPAAEVRRLEATSVSEEWDLTLAGRTYKGTVDGTMSGQEVVERVKPTGTTVGVYEVTVQPISAVLLEWEVSGEGSSSTGSGGTSGLGGELSSGGQHLASVSAILITLMIVAMVSLIYG